MANTVLLKRRIKTSRNVSKTTRAMQMIAASKLKRAQEAVLASRPYVEKLGSLCKEVGEKTDALSHPYLLQKDTKQRSELLFILAPDKGLCGGLVSNLVKTYLEFSKASYVKIVTVGKKIEPAAARSQNELVASFPFGTSLPTFEATEGIITIIKDYYINQKVESVKILYHKFLGLFSQVTTVLTLLPINLEKENTKHVSEYQLFEPTLQEILPYLLERYVEMAVYQCLLENFASEQAARMIAMQNATDNARDIIFELTLEYNKMRQEKITNEILDISSEGVNQYA
ncbi:MAG: ATP synthase F1 subunit gamma [Candidatus Levybacteria bacterium RIFCSPHIGHO2_02_FULL_42_12]|nr:MAG: ATP synthase F1 subunit gamma [Candidatus Levybacteria bacterium RIFCSPHIGHO2_02_FULL_42_12]